MSSGFDDEGTILPTECIHEKNDLLPSEWISRGSIRVKGPLCSLIMDASLLPRVVMDILSAMAHASCISRGAASMDPYATQCQEGHKGNCAVSASQVALQNQ